MFKNFNLNQSLSQMSSMALRMAETSVEESPPDGQQEVRQQIEKIGADRDHFRALATQFRSEADGSEEQSETSNKQIQRLKTHLLSVEENYTKEVLESVQRERDLRRRLALLETEINQLKERDERRERDFRNVQTERDIARNQVFSLEDRICAQSSSVTNLQLVIEQIQKENERKLAFVESKLERQLELERQRTRDAIKQVREQEARLHETLEALGAASRLSESLDLKEQRVAELKREALRKEQMILQLRQEVNELKDNNESKVDKQVIKGLVIGYFLAPNHRKADVQRLLARILDFNEQEMTKTGIIVGKRKEDQSLSQKFVEFLESESQKSTKTADKELMNSLSKQMISSFENSSLKRNSSQNSLLFSNNDFETNFSPLLVSTSEPNVK